MEEYEKYNQNNYSYGKIPFDEEPISREPIRPSFGTTRRYRPQHGYNETGNSEGRKQGFSKNLTIVVAIMFVINIIFGGLIVRLFILSGKPKVIQNSNISITAEDSGGMWAAATKAKLSAVCVGAKYTGDVTYSTFFKMSSNGAGVVIDIDKEAGNATILTCYHVVKPDTSKVYVLLIGSYTPIAATVVGYSHTNDVAVLRITGSNEVKESVAQACEVADSGQMAEGSAVVAVGNPLAMGFSVTSGILSVTREMVLVEDQPEKMRLMRIDAAINAGNSGGGVFNNLGQLVGIVNAKALDELKSSKINPKEAIAFAIPSNVAYSLAKNIVRNSGTPMAVTVGLTFKSGTEQDGLDATTGKIVQKVTYTANASAMSEGCVNNDEVVKFEYTNYKGEEVVVNVKSIDDFDDHMFNMVPGSTIKFTIIRSGVTHTLNLTAVSVAVS